MKLLLVFNPNAAVRRAARLLPRIREALGAFAEVETLVTQSAGDGTRLVVSADLSQYHGVVAAGGDGSLFEVLNGLCVHSKPDRIPLGVIPIGTGNAFARDLGLQPGDWQKAVELVGRQRRLRVDVGRVETSQETYHFLNIVGAGLPVEAMHTAYRLKWLGRSAYTLAVLYKIFNLNSYPLAIEIDGKKINQDGLFVEVSNTRYTGTSFLIAPQAEFDDGQFDVTLVRRMSRSRLLRLFPTIYRGEHLRFEEVSTFRGRQVRLLGPAGLALAPDGEIRGSLPATITCLPGELEVFG